MLPRVFICVLFLSALPFSCSQVQRILYDYDYHFPKLIADIIKKLLLKLTIGIDVIVAFESTSQKLFQLDTLNAVLQHLGMTTTVSLCGFWEQSHSMLILADSHMSFRRALLSTGNNQYEFRGYFLVYITKYISKAELTKIFKECLENHIIDIVVIMTIQSMNELLLFTYFPFTHGNCFNHEPVPICLYFSDIFDTYNGNECTLYPEKLTNFHGCEVIANAFEMAPYLTFNKDSTGIISLSSLEGEVVNTLAKNLNFKITFLTPDRSQTHDRVKLLTSGPANFSIGRLRTTTIQRRNVSSSTAYFKSDLVIVTRMGRPLYSLERLLSPASTDVWFSFVIFMTAAYTVVIVVHRIFPAARKLILGEGNRVPTYWVWVTTLGGPVEYNPSQNFARYTLLQWIALTFFLRSGYQTFFYKSIRMNWKASTANSLGEVLTNGYELQATLETYRSLSEISLLVGRVGVFNGSEMEILQSLDRSHGNLAVIAPYEVFRYYKRMINHSNLTMIKEPVLEQMICMHFRTKSYLRGPFDSNLRLLGVSGLLPHWWAIYVPLPVKSKSVTTNPRKITLADIEGHFQVYSFAIINSFIALAIEFISLKVRFLRRIFI